jgi:hypothetical protein
MEPKVMFHDVSPTESRSVDGGLSLSGILDAISSAIQYVGGLFSGLPWNGPPEVHFPPSGPVIPPIH